MVDDRAKGIHCPASGQFLALFVVPSQTILEAVDLRGAVELQPKFFLQISLDFPHGFVNLPFVCPNEKQIVCVSQVFHSGKRRCEMVKLFQVEIEQPWARKMSKDKPYDFFGLDFLRSVVEKLKHEPHPSFVLHGSIKKFGKYLYVNGSVCTFHVHFRHIRFLSCPHPLFQPLYGCMWSELPHMLLPVPVLRDELRYATIDLFVEAIQEDFLERLDEHVVKNLLRTKFRFFNGSFLSVCAVDNLMRIVLARPVVCVQCTFCNMVIRSVKIRKGS